jgi:cellulose synthase/poly-beta-1,6-N-acetylglucosamine synthase-like glycosyltransferase
MTTVAAGIALGCVALLAWTWVGYPVVIALLARLRRPPAVRAGDVPHVSVVVATRDEASLVAARMHDLRDGDWPADRLEVIIAVDAGTPTERRAGLAALAGEGVVVVDGDAPAGKATALNAGVRAARGSVLVFTDVQQRFAPDAIARLVAGVGADPRMPVVGGALQLPGDAPGASRSPVEWYWHFERLLRAAEARLHSTIGVSGSIYAMRREAWTPLPAQLILDDVFVPMRAVLGGARVGYDPEAHAWDVRRTSADQERGRKVRTLTGNFQLVAWLPGLLLPWRNPVWAQFVCHKLLRLLTPWLVLGACVATGVWIVASMPGAVAIRAVAAVAFVVAVAMVVPRIGPRLRGLVRWGWSLQVAVVQATANGVRGRWDVWH